MTDREIADLQFQAVRALYRLVKVLPPGTAEAAQAQADADRWQRMGNVRWAMSRGKTAAQIAAVQS